VDLLVEVAEVRGRCPVYAAGDSFRLLDGWRLTSDRPLCMHALASLLPYYNALRFADPGDLGLADRDDPRALDVQCPDPCVQTGGGTVLFRVTLSTSNGGGPGGPS
jgi:uncharacterized repeat protein (TIGR04076 family)